jgi:hypothetical protein
MNLFSKNLAVAIAASCLMSGSALALTKADIEVLKDKMASVKVVEAPSTAAKLIANSRKLDRQETAVTIVKSVAEAHSPALGKVITVVLSRVPEATDAVVRAALDAAPERAGVIVAAAAAANPEQLEQVSAVARSLVPAESIAISREVAFARAQSVQSVPLAPTPVLARPVAVGVFGSGATVTQSNATFVVVVTNVVVQTNGGVVTVTTNTQSVTTTNVIVTVQNGYGGADPNRP